MFYLICGQQEVHWMKHSFDIAFQMIKSYLTGFVAMQDFIVKSLKKFSAVFPEVTLQP